MGQIISSLFSGFGITDVIDIAIVSFLIYKLLGFIRSTRAEQLAKGLVVVVVAAFLSKILNLYIVNWIFTGILNVGIVALVVVFQPELRRGLEYLGRGKFTRQFSLQQEEISENVDAIVSEPLCNGLVRMNGVSVASESGNMHIVLFESVFEFLEFARIREKFLSVAKSLSGIPAAADLDPVDAQPFYDSESLVKAPVAKKVGKADAHIHR